MDYKTIGKQLQIEQELCHNHLDGGVLSREAGIARFNEEAEKHGLKPLRDPKGYMTLDGNVYQAIKDTYEAKYEARAQDIEDGFSLGTTYAMDYVLDHLDSTVRKDSKRFLPEGMVYGDLRFIKNTPEIQDKIDRVVDRRVEMTLKYSISRSIEDADFRRTFVLYDQAGKDLAEAIQPSNENNMTL